MRSSGLFLSALAHALEPAEREVVLGDLAESGEGVGAATRHLLGLIVRRQRDARRGPCCVHAEGIRYR